MTRSDEALRNGSGPASPNKGLNSLARRIGERTAEIRNRAVELANDKPLEMLAVIAGIAATAGAATRLWRSTRNA